MKFKKKNKNNKGSGKFFLKNTNPGKQAEKCYKLAMQALEDEDYQTVYFYAEQGLKAAPGYSPLFQPAYKAIIKLDDPEKTFFVLKQSWRHGYEKAKVNLVVLASLAYDFKNFELAVEVLSAVLESRNTFSGRFRRGQKSYAQRLLGKARLMVKDSKASPVEKTSLHKKKSGQHFKEPKTPQKQKNQNSLRGGEAARSAPEQEAERSVPENEVDRDVPELELVFHEESDPVKALPGPDRVSTPGRLELALWGYRLSFRSSYDQLLCLPHVHGIRSFWYQEETARKAMKNYRGRALLADEVGLGKTIEACLILKEYIMRGLVRNALILVPSALVAQWQEELRQKFFLSFVSSNDPVFKSDPRAFWAEPFLLLSLQTARTTQHFEQVTSRPYDLVIVDEAHHLKNRNTRNWKLVNSIQKSFL
ncbi:MAG: SNF2-related protein, partial [Thermodesulfobacteriota bacterium]